MDASSYLRLALMFGENKASTFNKNLEKMIALVLYDCYNQGLTVANIIKEIKDKYALDFSDSEIIQTIEHKHQQRIIEVNDTHDIALREYSITPAEYEKIGARTDEASIRGMVHSFLMFHPEIELGEDDFCQLLIKYLYGVFNSNADTILAMLNGDKSGINLVNFDYSPDEKEIINTFVFWEDAEKNRRVYQLISVCFDYCMMTVRKDKSVYSKIFNQKKFYLDTNIIFRLMGLNNESRKSVIDAFILKCREVGIQILYSNHTKKELENTIDYYVKQIKDTLNGSAPLSVRAMACMNSRLSNSDFYEAYVKWAHNPINRVNDYNAFASDLKRTASTILNAFRQINFDDYAGRNVKSFADQFDSLKQYKIQHRKNFYDPAIKADVNNYLYVQERNSKGRGSDFFSIDNYLISADHAFADWEREKRPCTIPTVVLPSVWYSIILQYAGRTTDDDYSSFAKFLKFSFSDSIEAPDPRKMEILRYVLGLQEPVDIKEKTVFDISEKLLNEYKDLDSEEVVETAHQYVIDQELEVERKKVEAQSDELRTELQRTREQGEIDKKKAAEDAYNKVIGELVERQTPKTICKYWMITIAMLLVAIAVIVFGAWWTCRYISGLQKNFDENIIKVIEFCASIVFGMISWFVCKMIIDNVFCGLKSNDIETKVRRKIEKEHPMN